MDCDEPELEPSSTISPTLISFKNCNLEKEKLKVIDTFRWVTRSGFYNFYDAIERSKKEFELQAMKTKSLKHLNYIKIDIFLLDKVCEIKTLNKDCSFVEALNEAHEMVKKELELK